MRNQTNNTIQAPRANGRPAYEVFTVQTSDPLLQDSTFVSVSLGRDQLAAGQQVHRMLTLPLGALVFFLAGKVCTHAGMINRTHGQKDGCSFTFAAWPLASKVPLLAPHVPDGKFLRYVRYVAEGWVEEKEFICTVAKLPHAIANNLREQVGLDLPENLLDIYWSENDLKRLRSQAAGRQHFAELVNNQLAELVVEMAAG